MPSAHFDGLKSLFRSTESRRGRRSIARRAASSRRPLAEQLEDRKLLTTFMMLNDPLVTEGDSGTKEMSFTVSLAVTTSNTVTVDYQTEDHSAIAGPDYIATRGTLSFAPGQKTGTISVPIVGDNVAEPTEAFYLRLSNSVNALTIKSVGVATIMDGDTAVAPQPPVEVPIIDVPPVTPIENPVLPPVEAPIVDDGPPPVTSPSQPSPFMTVSDPLFTESDGTTQVSFTVSLAVTTGNTVTVDYQTADYTARAGSDYIATRGTLSIAPGQKTGTISVPIVGDNVFETSEAFHLNLSNPVNAVVIKSLGLGTIMDDDTAAAPELSINDPRIEEGQGGTSLLTYNVSLNTAAYDRVVSVKVQTANATATAGVDYAAKTEVLTFSPGETVKPFSVTVYGDTELELSEALYAMMSEATVAVKKANGVGFS